MIEITEENLIESITNIAKAYDSGAIDIDALEKAKKNISELQKKEITDKNGQKRTVYVKIGEDEKKEASTNSQEPEEEKKDSKAKESEEHAKDASTNDLEHYVKNGEDKELKNIAQAELDKRGEGNDTHAIAHGKLFDALQSGKFKKMDRVKQGKLIDAAQSDTRDIESNLEQNFTDEEIDALDDYVSINYKKINGFLRDPENVKISKKDQETIDQIDSAIKKHKLKEDLVVYRSLSGTEGLKEDKAFQSTSIDPYASYQFKSDGGKIYKLTIPAGTNYAYLGGGEKELLLPRDLDLSKFVTKDPTPEKKKATKSKKKKEV